MEFRVAVTLAGVSVLVASTALGADSSKDKLLDGVVARASAVFAARIEFEVRTDHWQSDQRVSSTTDAGMLTVSGDDWILRHQDSPNFFMNRNGSTVRFYRTDSPTRGPYRTLHLDAPLSLADAASTNYVLSVVQNGTLWYPSQVEFVDQQRDRVEVKGNVDLNGLATTCLEWRVDAKDFSQAVVVVPHGLQQDLAGYLRIYVAPELGHALPRIEYVTLAGKMDRRWESSEFEEVDNGLYFPRTTVCETAGQHDHSSVMFQVSRIDHVNRSLPADSLTISVPADTRVRDSRPGVPQSIFRLKEAQDFDEIVQGLEGREDRRRGWSVFRKACLAVNGLLVGLLLLAWVRQQCCSS